MVKSELLDDVTKRVGNLVERLPAAVEGLTVEQMSKPAPGGPWSLGGIIEHMNIAVAPYLDVVGPLVEKSTGHPADETVSNTFMGRMITRGGGPTGNAPAPTVSHPKQTKYDPKILEDWISHHKRYLEIAEGARDADFRQKYANPLIGILRMNVTDFFTIMAAHAERHVQQIEDRKSGVV